MLIIPNISNAATKQTYSDTAQGIEWTYELDANDNVVNLKCTTTSVKGAVTIPSKIDGKTVISLAGNGYEDGAFTDCAGLTKVTIPNTITKIGQYAFYNRVGLTEVTIPNSVTTIGDYAFYGCSGLKALVIPDSTTTIGKGAFWGCKGLTSITLSKNLISIGTNAFTSCSGVKSIVIPDSVTTIGKSAFEDCSGLTSITLSKNLTKISYRTFEDCTGLTSVIIPDSVTTIEGGYSSIYGAFGDCTNLQKVLIPDTVASIGVGAFQGCNKLTIYGNDGMTSKQYAEENDISFDYIANWDKATSGADITPPTVESIEIPYNSVLSYQDDSKMFMVPTGTKFQINVQFNEVIEGTTVPTLTIKFGEGEKIQLTEGTVAGSKITYIYTIKDTDKGILTTVDFSGGNIKDAAGNKATLSCPTVKVSSVWGGYLVYANGTATNPDSSNNSNNTNNNTNNNADNNANNNTNNNTNNSANKDNTTAPSKIPQTGESVMIIAIIISVIGIGAYACVRYNRYKGI